MTIKSENRFVEGEETRVLAFGFEGEETRVLAFGILSLIVSALMMKIYNCNHYYSSLTFD